MSPLDELIKRYPDLVVCRDNIEEMYKQLVTCFENNGRLYICGNGGSASDALHIVGELVKAFTIPRKVDDDFAEVVDTKLVANLQGALPAYALVENVALTSAYANDVDPEYVFAQQVYAYVREGDCVLGISTSGNSKNVLHALDAAHGRGAVALGLLGRDGGKMKEVCDISVIVPATETYKIQELHLPVYHTLCIMIEEYFWGKHE